MEISPEKEAKIESCTHIFCYDCIKQWSTQKNQCPNCRMWFNKILSKAEGCSNFEVETEVPNIIEQPELQMPDMEILFEGMGMMGIE